MANDLPYHSTKNICPEPFAKTHCKQEYIVENDFSEKVVS